MKRCNNNIPFRSQDRCPCCVWSGSNSRWGITSSWYLFLIQLFSSSHSPPRNLFLLPSYFHCCLDKSRHSRLYVYFVNYHKNNMISLIQHFCPSLEWELSMDGRVIKIIRWLNNRMNKRHTRYINHNFLFTIYLSQQHVGWAFYTQLVGAILHLLASSLGCFATSVAFRKSRTKLVRIDVSKN